jgi:hypothetical protein
MMARRESAAETLNRTCSCSATDLTRLRDHIDRTTGYPQSIVQTHPNLFTNIPVFLDRAHFVVMQQAINAIERVVNSHQYRQKTLEFAPAISRTVASQAGVFLGYDFHIGAHGPRLIEINTNAGGAFLNIAARDHQVACCDVANEFLAGLPTSKQLESVVLAMFEREWQLAGRGRPLKHIAIVDEKPTTQYLYPDFLLAKQVFESHGIRTDIVDVAELTIEAGQVMVDGDPVDLIYNRSTDFYLQSPETLALRQAFERDLAVVTPHPRAHALYANKQNLILLSDAVALSGLGVEAETFELLTRIVPSTRKVNEGDESWWKDRKAWFFKPESSFGGRGAYRGDKMTRRAFADVVKGNYIAQELAPPGERIHATDGDAKSLKVDVRCYVYQGEIQLMAARLYQGQTTNFRTAGGGFAPVYIVQAAD